MKTQDLDASMANSYLESYAWPVLPLAGIISAILSFATPGSSVVVGIVFGFVMAVYFFIFWRLRSVGRIALLICVSALAYPCAVFGSLFALGILKFPLWIPFASLENGGEVSVVFTAGLIGGFILAGTIRRILGYSGTTLHSELKFGLLGALVSAILGVIGWQLSPTLGKWLWDLLPGAPYVSPDSYPMRSLYVVWQPVMALFLGIVAAFQDRLASTQEHELSVSSVRQTNPAFKVPSFSWEANIIAATVIFGLIATVFLAPRISLALSKYEAARRKEQRTEQRIREAPSMERLPQVAPMTDQQAFIMDQIAGVAPFRPVTYNEGEIKKRDSVKPFNYLYSLTYFPPDEIKSQSLIYAGSVMVIIQQYPNSEWATYLAKYPPSMVDLPEGSKLHMRVMKFQNTVWSDVYETGIPAQLYYQWPSKNDVVAITYNWPFKNSDEFLRVYLQKYPSSLK